jgi:hypothetical protein
VELDAKYPLGHILHVQRKDYRAENALKARFSPLPLCNSRLPQRRGKNSQNVNKVRNYIVNALIKAFRNKAPRVPSVFLNLPFKIRPLSLSPLTLTPSFFFRCHLLPNSEHATKAGGAKTQLLLLLLLQEID